MQGKHHLSTSPDYPVTGDFRLYKSLQAKFTLSLRQACNKFKKEVLTAFQYSDINSNLDKKERFKT